MGEEAARPVSADCTAMLTAGMLVKVVNDLPLPPGCGERQTVAVGVCGHELVINSESLSCPKAWPALGANSVPWCYPQFPTLTGDSQT